MISLSISLLDCNFFSCSITDKGFAALVSRIGKSLPYLRQLSLNFGGSQITNDGLEALGREFENHLTKLHKLTVNFSECRKIKENGIIELSEKIASSLTYLNELNLHLLGCSLTSDVIKKIGLAIAKYQPPLQKLNFSFRVWGQMSDDLKEVLSFVPVVTFEEW